MTACRKEYLIRFDAAKCVQCHGGETACKAWAGASLTASASGGS